MKVYFVQWYLSSSPTAVVSAISSLCGSENNIIINIRDSKLRKGRIETVDGTLNSINNYAVHDVYYDAKKR